MKLPVNGAGSGLGNRIKSPDKNPPGKNPPEKIPLNAVEREPVETRVLNPNATEASYKPEQRSYRKTKLKLFFFILFFFSGGFWSGGFYPGTIKSRSILYINSWKLTVIILSYLNNVFLLFWSYSKKIQESASALLTKITSKNKITLGAFVLNIKIYHHLLAIQIIYIYRQNIFIQTC